jgi:hypothetical protein
MCSPFIARDQVSHPHKSCKNRSTFVCCTIYGFWMRRQRILKRMTTSISQIWSTFNLFLMWFWFVTIVLKHLNSWQHPCKSVSTITVVLRLKLRFSVVWFRQTAHEFHTGNRNYLLWWKLLLAVWWMHQYSTKMRAAVFSCFLSVFILWTTRAIGHDPYTHKGRKRAFIAELIISSTKSADQTKQFDWFAFRASKHEYPYRRSQLLSACLHFVKNGTVLHIGLWY